MPELPGVGAGEAESSSGLLAQGDRATRNMSSRGPWDPALFKDDDGRWYLYWGSSNVFPLYGIEIDFGGRFAAAHPTSASRAH